MVNELRSNNAIDAVIALLQQRYGLSRPKWAEDVSTELLGELALMFYKVITYNTEMKRLKGGKILNVTRVHAKDPSRVRGVKRPLTQILPNMVENVDLYKSIHQPNFWNRLPLPSYALCEEQFKVRNFRYII